MGVQNYHPELSFVGRGMRLEAYSEGQLLAWLRKLEGQYRGFEAGGLDLDLTRGKPSIAQLGLSSALDGILGGDYRLTDGSDARGYGGLDGIPEARELAAEWLGVRETEVLVGGNSSLTLMYLFMLSAHMLGLRGSGPAWREQSGGARFLCPVPGYDRRFAICEALGIEMLPVPMDADGPDMDVVESLVTAGGFFVFFDALPGLAAGIIDRAAAAGVKLTPAGAAFPYGRDREDRNIRLAPSFPPVDDVDRAMQVFVNCVQSCSVEKQLQELAADG